MFKMMMKQCIVLAAVLLGMASCVAAYKDMPVVNDRPIIGILTIPNDWPFKGNSYFAASYVKWLESGGARVAPIFYTDSAEDMAARVKGLNGVLFTGGGAAFVNPDGTFTEFALAGQRVLNAVLEANREGEYMPLWATCMGFELVNVLMGNVSVLVAGFDSENITLPLDFTSYGPGARMMQHNSEVVNILNTQPVTMNNHHSGVTPDAFNTNDNLTSFFNVISTNKGRKGREFVSTIEGKNMPIYASQWHPEKVQFEWWAREVINHDPDSVKANSHFAHFFVNETRKNTRSFPTPMDEQNALIYNYDTTFTGPTIGDFDTCYFFE